MPTWTKEVVDLSVAGSSLTVDNIKIDGTNIGHVDDTDLLSLSSGVLTVNDRVNTGTIATTGNATIGGDLTITGGDLTLGSVNYLSDSSATGTLKNIDALDATTEATIEAAMDTLPNVTSVGTLSTLTVDNVIVNGTTVGHTSDTDLMTLASAALTLKGTLTVGIDGTGHDVKFFGDTSSNYMLWNTSGDRLDIITTHNNTALRVQSNAARSTSDAPDIEIRKHSVPNDDDYLGSIKWISLDAGGSTGRTYGEIDCFVRDQDDGAADGSIIFNVLSHGSVTQGLKIRSTNNGSSADVEVAVNKGNLVVGANTQIQGVVDIKRKDSDEFGYIKMYSSGGTESYLFVADNGTLRIHDSIPTANTDGSAV